MGRCGPTSRDVLRASPKRWQCRRVGVAGWGGPVAAAAVCVDPLQCHAEQDACAKRCPLQFTIQCRRMPGVVGGLGPGPRRVHQQAGRGGMVRPCPSPTPPSHQGSLGILVLINGSRLSIPY